MVNQNITTKVFFSLILIISIFSNINGQDCIDYPDIQGAPCKDCAPAGWTPFNMFLIHVHIIPPVNAPLPQTNCVSLTNISGPSPSGGNVVVLFGDDSNADITSITTTINGLDTDITYVFGLYWEGISADCAIHDYNNGILKIYIEGQLYEFTGATEWELAEVCFTPTSSSVEIVITTYDPGEHSVIIVDGNFDCSIAEQCCTLSPSIAEDNYSVCPEETIQLDANYQNEIGAVQIEWTCDPPEGISYLSATNVISPEFTFPEPALDHAGETYKFTMTVQDDVCMQSLECIEIEVRPSIVPLFDIDLCDLDLTAQLPTESENGYTGTWDGNTDISLSGGNSVPFTFTISDGQNNCLESYDYEFFVNEGFTPNFGVAEEYCLSDESYYVLPAVSLEFIEGDWIPINEFNPSELGLGSHAFTFIPDDIFCASSFELIIDVVIGNSPSFNLPEQFCSDPSFFVLPQESMEGISGSWSLDSIDLSIPIQDDILVFTPDGSNNCYGGVNYEYSVDQSITPLFDLPQSICREDIIISFDPVSTQNITGSWTPSEFNPDTASTFISLIWTPENQDACIMPLEVNIPIIDKEIIDINLPDTLCAEDMTYVLPDIDMIVGTWNIIEIDLMSNIGTSIIVTYTVEDNQCYQDFTDTIYVAGLEVPQFSIADSYCSNDASFTLPDTSDDFVQGVWNVNNIDPSLQDSLVIVFTPDSEGCYDAFSQTLYFTELTIPTFDIPSIMCKDEGPFTFPNISENEINGSWSVIEFDPSAIDQSTFSNTFTPDDASCTSTFSLTIEVLSFEGVSIAITEPSSCESEDGSIQIIGASTDMQLSTDNGGSWQPITDIENLTSGSYNLQLRFQPLPSCNIAYTPQLNSPESPIIELLIATDPSSCGQEDGRIECVAEGSSDLEYSIDNDSWKTSNIFENLGQDIYVVYVRLASQIDCVSSASIEIEDPITDEICDGIDNNCNGEIDEDLTTQAYYADRDMDGFGDPNDQVNDCIQPQNYVLDNTDCDDDNSDIFPGAEEIPNNGIDEDCDGADLTTSVHELADQKIDIYPNPTNGFVTIDVEEGSHISISLYDMTGKLLIKQRQISNLDLSEYTNGIYLIKITNHISSESIVEKIVLYQ